MGHRALVARERADGRHDVHRSQWGGADSTLARRLTAGDWPPDGVDPAPTATDVSWADLLAGHLDPLLHEALYVVEPTDEVRAYRPLWLGVDRDDPRRPDGPDDPDGLVVAVDWADPADVAHVRGWLAGARAVARATCETGPLASAEAATLLEQRLRAWAGDREVVRAP